MTSNEHDKTRRLVAETISKYSPELQNWLYGDNANRKPDWVSLKEALDELQENPPPPQPSMIVVGPRTYDHLLAERERSLDASASLLDVPIFKWDPNPPKLTRWQKLKIRLRSKWGTLRNLRVVDQRDYHHHYDC